MSNENTAQNASLYHRLGGAAGIHTLVEEIVDAHMNNPAIQTRFLPYQSDPEHLETVKEHLRNFLASGTGGTEQYEGRSMPDAHRGMNISEYEYMAAVDDILSVLDKNDIDEESRKDILAIAYSLKGEIMHM